MISDEEPLVAPAAPYPFSVTIERTVPAADGWFGAPHTEYVIQIHDCGAVIEQKRRYRAFDWLHQELKEKGLGLLNIPPKTWQNNDPNTIEMRRVALQDFLQQLCRDTFVMRHDEIWYFLELDNASAAIPRLIYLLKDPDAGPSDIMHSLRLVEKVALEEDNFYRFSQGDFMSTLVSVSARFERVSSLCSPAENVEVQGMVFRILTRLVHRQNLRQLILESGGISAGFTALQNSYAIQREQGEVLRVIIRHFLVSLLEVRPASLAYFFDHENGLTTLRSVLENCPQESVFCANMLWTSLLDPTGSILLILRESTGFRLLGDLLKCENADARVYGGLLLSQVVHVGGLDASVRQPVLATLANSVAEIESMCGTVFSVLDATTSVEFSLLQRLCQVGGDLPRLRKLLDSDEIVVVDFVIWVLDMFVKRSPENQTPHIVREFQQVGIVDRVQKLAMTDLSGASRARAALLLQTSSALILPDGSVSPTASPKQYRFAQVSGLGSSHSSPVRGDAVTLRGTEPLKKLQERFPVLEVLRSVSKELSEAALLALARAEQDVARCGQIVNRRQANPLADDHVTPAMEAFQQASARMTNRRAGLRKIVFLRVWRPLPCFLFFNFLVQCRSSAMRTWRGQPCGGAQGSRAGSRLRQILARELIEADHSCERAKNSNRGNFRHLR